MQRKGKEGKKKGGVKEVAQAEQPQGKAGDQTDDLLFPTEEELRAMKAGSKDADKSAPPEGAAGKADSAKTKPDDPGSADARLQGERTRASRRTGRAVPVISIDSNVDPESWAEYGGWYRQDYAIFYRPTGHKDKFIYSWLFLTGPQAPKGDEARRAAVFELISRARTPRGHARNAAASTNHPGQRAGRQFLPAFGREQKGRFTNFIHEPHLGILENRGLF